MIHIGKQIAMDDDWVMEKLKELDEACYNERGNIRAIVSEMVPMYHYNEEKDPGAWEFADLPGGELKENHVHEKR